MEACSVDSYSLSRACIRYIHIALWVRKVVLNELDGWFHFKRPVGSLWIVPEEVLHQSDVELFRVKELFVEVLHKLRAVVGQDVLAREGEEEDGEIEEVLGGLAGVAPCGPGQGETGGRPSWGGLVAGV